MRKSQFTDNTTNLDLEATGKVSWVAFLKSIRFTQPSAQRAKNDPAPRTTIASFARFDQRVPGASKPIAEDSLLVRSAN